MPTPQTGALRADPPATMGPMGTMFCLAVLLVLVLAGLIGQPSDEKQSSSDSCSEQVLVIPNDDGPKPCISCGGSHVKGEDGSIPCGF